MTHDEIDILWQRAMDQSVSAGEMFTRHRFAALVAEAERESCAKVCRDRYDEGMAGHEALDCEALILARGKA